ncbi:MAG: sugar phosphate isomerase/epimerase [Clostridia bacterium]|nr:sugar phosphate isomerase/epimerase [Oscillospiraceae bacterium]MBQ7445623.1 sugar phosphate isomerase/epimerase [Clostridia bacterium]
MRVGAQLFTVREYCRDLEGFSETLKKVADIGYKYVQVSGTCPFEAKWLRDELDRNGLSCILTHTNPDAIKNDTAAVIENHKIFGSKLVGIGAMPGGFQKADPDAFINDFKPAARMIAESGLYFMYHNHQFEFAKDAGGITIMERLAAAFTPEEMGFTVDTYWVQFGGGDPAQWIKNLRGRVPAIHLKDMSIFENRQRMAVVGEGNINFSRVLYEAENAGTEYLLVEQDDCNGEDPFECLKRSYRRLTSWGLN